MQNSLPKFIHKYFWGDDLKQLNWQDHKKYIIQTILEKGDLQAASWLLHNTDKTDLQRQLTLLSLTPKSANFWRQYLS